MSDNSFFCYQNDTFSVLAHIKSKQKYHFHLIYIN